MTIVFIRYPLNKINLDLSFFFYFNKKVSVYKPRPIFELCTFNPFITFIHMFFQKLTEDVVTKHSALKTNINIPRMQNDEMNFHNIFRL